MAVVSRREDVASVKKINVILKYTLKRILSVADRSVFNLRALKTVEKLI